MTYKFNYDRDKHGVSAPKLKREIIKLYGTTCYLCGWENVKKPEIEHKVPVMLGGSITHITNLGLVCRDCHLKKTKLDKKIIHLLKELGLIWKSHQGSEWMISLLNKKELEKFYNLYFNLLKDKQQEVKLEDCEDITFELNDVKKEDGNFNKYL